MLNPAGIKTVQHLWQLVRMQSWKGIYFNVFILYLHAAAGTDYQHRTFNIFEEVSQNAKQFFYY